MVWLVSGMRNLSNSSSSSSSGSSSSSSNGNSRAGIYTTSSAVQGRSGGVTVRYKSGVWW